LISQIWIVDGRHPVLIAIPEHATEFPAGHCYSPWYDEGCFAEIDEADLSTSLDTPAVTEVGRQAGLSSVRHPRVGRHSHIVHCS
jgi:hypothetical protein